MSGDSPATIQNIWICPFCGKPTVDIQLQDEHSDGYDIKFEGETDHYKVIILMIRCEDSLLGSAVSTCPAGGMYNLHIYTEHVHAYYY